MQAKRWSKILQSIRGEVGSWEILARFRWQIGAVIALAYFRRDVSPLLLVRFSEWWGDVTWPTKIQRQRQLQRQRQRQLKRQRQRNTTSAYFRDGMWSSLVLARFSSCCLGGGARFTGQWRRELRRRRRRGRIKNEQDRWSEGWRETIMRRRRRRVQRDSGNYPPMTTQAAGQQSNRETRKQTNKPSQQKVTSIHEWPLGANSWNMRERTFKIIIAKMVNVRWSASWQPWWGRTHL